MKLELRNNSKSLKSEGFENLLFQTECFVLRSLVRMDLFLKSNSSMMSMPLISLCGDLLIAIRNISVSPDSDITN